ncbi:MAG: prepilin-type N-terminal cleavage/methylation domain-containing protein [Phycisphaerales bacterium]|nr:prepilin-type N-terminal cleavage/methylation domain-containing protein [Phycisphaerales bacterium]
MKMADTYNFTRGIGVPPMFRRLLRRGLTLIEVLIAVFILGIGLIMVITVFPVGGEWTRQATEATIAQNVAQNALAILQTHCPPSSTTVSVATGTVANQIAASNLVAFPGLARTGDSTCIPVSEMCYQFGAESPCPADPLKATYFWTAMVRLVPNQVLAPYLKYDVYILVFKKGSADQLYSSTGEITGVRDVTKPCQPTLLKVSYSSGNFDTPTQKIVNAVPAIDAYGIGVQSGTVFRQGVWSGAGTPRPLLQGMTAPTGSPTEQVIVGMPPDGGTVSPLVYVYQTTLCWRAQ